MTNSEGVHDAAGLLVDDHGHAGAIEELQARIQSAEPDSEERAKALEALSFVKREGGE